MGSYLFYRGNVAWKRDRKPCSASPGSSTRGQGFAKGIPEEEDTEVELLSFCLSSPKHKTGDVGNCMTDIKNQVEI